MPQTIADCNCVSCVLLKALAEHYGSTELEAIQIVGDLSVTIVKVINGDEDTERRIQYRDAIINSILKHTATTAVQSEGRHHVH